MVISSDTPKSSSRPDRVRLQLRGLIALAIAILLPSSGVGAASGQEAIVRPDPLVSAVAMGDHVVVNIYVQDVQNLYGADIRLRYDPAILEVQDMNPNVYGVQVRPLSDFLHPDFVVRNKACNVVDLTDPDCSTAGMIRYALTQVSPSTPVSGSGPAAAIMFKRLTSDVATLEIVMHDLSNRNGGTIPSTAQDGRVELPVVHRWFLPSVMLVPHQGSQR